MSDSRSPQSRGFLKSLFRKAGLLALAGVIMAGAIMAEDAEARRMGGGRSMGRQSATATQQNQATPPSQSMQQGQAAQAQRAQPAPARCRRRAAGAQPLARADRRSGRGSRHRGVAVALRPRRRVRRRDGQHDHDRADRAGRRHAVPLHHAQAQRQCQYAGVRDAGAGAFAVRRHRLARGLNQEPSYSAAGVGWLSAATTLASTQRRCAATGRAGRFRHRSVHA